MYGIKGIIIGVRNVLVREGTLDESLLAQMVRLVNYCRAKGIEPVFLSNGAWQLGSKTPLDEALKAHLGDVRWFIAERNDCPYKPTAAATSAVIDSMKWGGSRILYLGNTVADMRTAVNGKILFLKATWYDTGTPYGITFKTPEEVARFIDIFCHREHAWHFELHNETLQFYSLAPFSTMTKRFPQYIPYSMDARETAKAWLGHPAFWSQYLWSTLYLSGLYEEFDYTAFYPGHRTNSPKSIVAESIGAFARCFRKHPLDDLIIRHKNATKSQSARIKGETVDPLNQLNTIHLCENPIMTSQGKRYVKSPLKEGKTVLIVDDICTEGYSLEAARLFIEQTGAKAICVSWLKTINTDYHQIVGPLEPASWAPYAPVEFKGIGTTASHQYDNFVTEKDAAEELSNKFDRFCNWRWDG